MRSLDELTARLRAATTPPSAPQELLGSEDVIHVPLFGQHCPICHKFRSRKNGLWSDDNPDEGWYDWWEPCALSFRAMAQLSIFHYPCDVCAKQRNVEPLLKERFGSVLFIFTALCRGGS